MSDGKYYWLKLKRDFFKRHDIHIINGMENGREIVLFYIKLMVESVDHEGTLRFSKDKPYTNGTLAGVTDTPQDIVETAMNTLIDFGLVEIAEDKTIILPKVIEMIDSASDSDGARRMRRLREQKANNLCESANNLCEQSEQDRTNSDESIEIRDKSIEYRDKSIVIGEKSPTKQFKVPSVDEISAYCQERNNSVDAQRFFDYYESKGWYVGKNKMKDWKAAVRTWERQDAPTSHCPTPKKNNPYDIDWSKV